MDTILHMGGYADFVWPAYALAFVALAGILIVTRVTLKKREQEFERLKRDRREGS
jgi:heme exporter protein D